MLSVFYNLNIEIIILFNVILSLSVCLTNKKFNNHRCYNLFLIICIIIFLVLIFSVTLLFREENPTSSNISLIPFRSYYLAAHGMKEMLRESILNILFFYPFGYLFGSLNIEKVKSKRWLIIPISCVLSFIIELSQYIFKLGYAEVDDVIHNTLGCAIGLLICVLLERLFKIKKDGKSDE